MLLCRGGGGDVERLIFTAVGAVHERRRGGVSTCISCAYGDNTGERRLWSGRALEGDDVCGMNSHPMPSECMVGG